MNTNDVTAALDAVDGYAKASEPGWDPGGMLGFGNLASLIVTLIVAAVLAYLIGAIKQKKEFGKWLNPFKKEYVFNIWKWLSFGFKAFAGELMPVGYVDRSDGKYASLTKVEVEEAFAYARDKMNELGATLSFYKTREFDCEDFVMMFISFAKFYAASNFGREDQGYPFFMFGYVRKSDGGRHVLVRALVDGETNVYYEGFPEEKYAVEKELAISEVKSCDLDFG